MRLQVEKINNLADIIGNCEEVEFQDRKEGDTEPSFSMLDISYPCGSPACLLGHHNVTEGRHAHDGSVARLALDLGIFHLEQAHDLCAPKHDCADYRSGPNSSSYITAQHAAAVLRNLADDGVVDWSAADLALSGGCRT